MPSDAPVLVTGAAGFVGLNLVERLSRRGVPVAALDIIEPPGRALAEPWSDGVTWLQADLESIDLDAASCVVHLAAVTAGPQRERTDAAGVVAVNVAGTQAVLDAARSLGAARFVYGSSGAVYGTRTFGDDPIDEGTPPEATSLYAVTKLAGEHLVLRHGALWDLPVAVARLGAAFGPWERATGSRDTLSPFLALAERALEGSHAVLPDAAPRQWTPVTEIAAVLDHLATGPTPRWDRYLVAAPEAVTLGDWARYLADRSDGFTWEVGADPDIPYDGDPKAPRARVIVERIQAEMDRWPARPTAEAFAGYFGWLTTSASSATTP